MRMPFGRRWWAREHLAQAGTRRPGLAARPAVEPMESRELLSAGMSFPYPFPTTPTPPPTRAPTPPTMSPAMPVPVATTQTMPHVMSHPAITPVTTHAVTPTTSMSPMLSTPMSPTASHMSRHSHGPSGVVTKPPHFYENFTGTKLPELNAVRASAKLLPSGSFAFMGMNQGKISTSVPALFVFGVDRSGNLPAGPFPNRPNIKFDAVVVVTVNPGGVVSGMVVDLANNMTTTPLPAGSFSIQGRQVQTIVPASDLPSTGLAPAQYRFNYWPEQFPGFQANLVASFVPEFADAPVGVSRV